MAEEKTNTPEITSDDLSMLRLLLHNVKGLSVVSSPSEAEVVYTERDD